MGNRISKVVTRTGDDGSTGLAGGERISKAHPRIQAMGSVDELNSCLGLLRSALAGAEHEALLAGIQQDLFDLGGELSMPGTELLSAAAVERLDEHLQTMNEILPPLREFILPAGSEAVCRAHMVRVVGRRAERDLVQLAEQDAVNPQSLRYLNRVSDLMFVLARFLARDAGNAEVCWDKSR